MVIRDVGDEEIIIMGYMFSTQNISGTILKSEVNTDFVYEPGPWRLQARI
jgi:hypothetical protein